MTKEIYDERGDTLIETVEAEPECGEDFCDACGDCLACYGSDPCYENGGGEHRWIQYGRKDES